MYHLILHKSPPRGNQNRKRLYPGSKFPDLRYLIGFTTEPAYLATPRVRRRVESSEPLRETLTDAWVLHGPPLSPASAEEIPASAFAWNADIDSRDISCPYLASQYSWINIPWSFTFQEQCRAFITADWEIASQFIAYGPEPYPHGYEATEKRIFEVYRDVEQLDSRLCGAQFFDYGREGDFVWQIAKAEGMPPLLICTKWSSEDLWWKKYLPLLTPAGSLERPRTPSPPVRYTAYQITEASLFQALWRHDPQEESYAEVAVSGSASVDRILALIDSSPSGLDNLQSLGTEAGWAYSRCFGGGSDEYHALFWANDSAITQKLYQHIRDATTPKGPVRCLGRF